MRLVYSNEPPLFGIVLVLSILFGWIPLVAGLGVMVVEALSKDARLLWVPAFYICGFFLFYLITHSAYVAYLRGTGARVGKGQFPDLNDKIEAACRKLGMAKPPDVYLLNSNGVLNAMASRFLFRNFLVLYSDIVNALDDRPDAVSFYIGHELGHIARGHLVWGPYLAPGKCFPLVGFAYRRAQEYSCDLHGLACCEGLEDAQRALVVLAAGKRRWKSLNLAAYGEQALMTRGFWMSFHELTGDYPWLVKRVGHVAAAAEDKNYRAPLRNPLAWLFGLFVPRFGTGAASGMSGLVSIAVVGIIAAIAIPAYQDYMARSQVSEAIQIAGSLEQPLANFYQTNHAWPNGLAPSFPKSNVGHFTDTVTLVDANGEVLGVMATMKSAGVVPGISGKSVELWTNDGGSTWHCGPGSSNPLDPKYLPASCRDGSAP
jgi:Zn-dependent protease with chaperone function/type II secretory pathway pseudopilin PulG